LELLSPAGSYEALIGAVQGGADAVYLGGEKFGARNSAKNFSVDEMKKWIDYCHLYGVKVYITVNTLIKDSEITELTEYIKDISAANADAVIVQDFAVYKIIKETVPELEVHASTQMTATSLEDVEFLYGLGFSRVVLARELLKEDIKYISDNSACELEVFVHGALCMCYSGQCLLSSIIGGRSGNRGRCAQPCRLSYTLVGDGEEKSGYILSPKDLCLVSKTDELKNAGVDSLKIEGRLKRPEYVACVTSIYRKYIDSRCKNVNKADMDELKSAFGRGFTYGKFGGDDGAVMMSLKNPSNTADNVFSQDVRNMCTENSSVRKVPITLFASMMKDEYFTVYASDGENSVFTKSERKPEKALKVATDRKRIEENLLKLGNTPFECTEIFVEMDEGLSLPVSEINAVRRNVCNLLSEERIKRQKRDVHEYTFNRNNIRQKRELFISCSVSTKEQLKVAEKLKIKRIYAPENLCSGDMIVKCSELTKYDKSSGDRLYISSVGEIKKHMKKELHGSSRLNITNSISGDFYSRYLNSAILSHELTVKEISEICKNVDMELGVTAYGYLELMICENCPIKAMGKCQNHRPVYKLKDRMNESFPLVCTESCQLKVLNSKPLFMADKLEDLKNIGLSFINLDFTIENADETEKIIKLYIDALSGKSVSSRAENTFTRGHFYRGIK